MMAGCPGPKGPEIAPAQGTVTMNGKPLEKIVLRFVPTGEGPESRAITDDQGHFVLKTTEEKPRDGATVGPHKVIIIDGSIYTKPFRGRASETEDLTEGKDPRISMKYSVLHAKPYEVNIASGENNLELKLDPFDGKSPLVPTIKP